MYLAGSARRNRATIILLVLSTFFHTVSSALTEPLFGSSRSLQGTDFCRKYKCVLINRYKNSQFTTVDFHVYPLSSPLPDAVNNNPELYQTLKNLPKEPSLLRVSRDRYNRISRVNVFLPEGFLSNDIALAEARLLADLILLMLRIEYVVEDGTHPDEITQRCFRPLRERTGEVVLQTGQVQFRSPDENKSFTITCYQSVGSAPDRVLRELAIAVK